MVMADNESSAFNLVPVLDSDESAEFDPATIQRVPTWTPRFLTFRTAVGGVVFASLLAIVLYAQSRIAPGSGADSANLRSSAMLQEVVPGAAMAAARKSFDAWSTGKYALSHDQCFTMAKSTTLDSFTLETNAAIIHAGIGTGYNGAQGLCAWIKDLDPFDFRTFKGAFYDLGDDRIVSAYTWTPTLKTASEFGAKSDHSVTDATVVLWKDGKMANFQYFFAEPETVEGLFVNHTHEHVEELSPNFQAWMKLRDNWAHGKFLGDKCQGIVADFVSPDWKGINKPEVPETGIKAEYSGLDGYCDWLHDLETFDFSKMMPTDFAINDDEFLMVNHYTPQLAVPEGAPPGEIADHVVKDVAKIKMQDGKMVEFKYFYAEPEMWKSLFSSVLEKKRE